MSTSHSHYEALVYNYIEALENGDFETVGYILQKAERSPTLEKMLSEVDEALYEEEFQLQSSPNPVYLEPAPDAMSEELWSDLLPPLLQPVQVEAKYTQIAESDSELEEPQPLLEPTLVLPGSNLINPSKSKGPMAGILSASAICALLLFSFGKGPLLEFFGKSVPSSAVKTKHPANSVAQEKLLQACQADNKPDAPVVPEKLMANNWIHSVSQQPQKVVKLLMSGRTNGDLKALLLHQKLSEVIGQKREMQKLSPFHKIIRARLYLRLAKFHKKNYQMALSFSHEVFTRRLARNKKLQLGKLFHYYWGRLLCLQGKKQAGHKALQEALHQVPKNRIARVKTWMAVCQPSKVSPKTTMKALAAITFKDDPDGWAEWVAVHHHYRLAHQQIPKHLSPRAAMYASVWKGHEVRWPSTFLRTPVESERIKENSIHTKLKYYDPMLFAMMVSDYTQRALRYLKATPKEDRYASFFKAEAYFLQGQHKQAKQLWTTFLQRLPKKLSWPYLLFSNRLTSKSLKNEACYYQARLHAKSHPTLSKRILKELSKGSASTRSLAGLGFLYTGTNKKKGFDWLLQGVKEAKKEEKRLHKQYSALAKQASQTQQQGGRLVIHLRLHRFVSRSAYLWGGMGAMMIKDGQKATHWMEALHRKERPYEITGENSPLQLTSTARAYAKFGKLGVATLFFAKNRRHFPSLTQLWSLIRMWRIIEGMDSAPLVKTG